MAEYKFTQDWFYWAPEVWAQFAPLLPARRKFLEIGSFEGRSTVWTLENMLEDGGSGLRFEVQGLPAFAVKYQGQVHAYLNQCAHVAMEMDWQAGQFFDFDAQYLMCATHGALLRTAHCLGVCLAGAVAYFGVLFALGVSAKQWRH